LHEVTRVTPPIISREIAVGEVHPGSVRVRL